MYATAAHYTPSTEIKLSGSLAKKFGRVHRRILATGTIAEAFSALKATLPGFEQELRRLDRLGLGFAIFRNRKNVNLDAFQRGGVKELRIVPVVDGRKSGVLAVIGIALIAVASFYSGGLAAGFASTGFAGGAVAWGGAALLAGGVMQLMSPQSQGLELSSAAANKPSYAFGSARNTTESGLPVPICIGDRRWGGAIISVSIQAEDIA